MIPLGSLVVGDAGRDAVHIAIAPMVAGEALSPGQHVGVLQNGTAGHSPAPVGIVDPFLPAEIEPGARFWLCLYPNTITSLRHDWTHPALDAVTGRIQSALVAESEVWLRQYAEDIGLSYGAVMKAAVEYIKFGEYHVFRDHDTPERAYDRGFWRHYEIVTGTVVEDHDAVPFTCSC